MIVPRLAPTLSQPATFGKPRSDFQSLFVVAMGPLAVSAAILPRRKTASRRACTRRWSFPDRVTRFECVPTGEVLDNATPRNEDLFGAIRVERIQDHSRLATALESAVEAAL